MSWVEYREQKPVWQEGKKLLINDIDFGPIIVIGVYRGDIDEGEEGYPEEAGCQGLFLEEDNNCGGQSNEFLHWMEIPAVPISQPQLFYFSQHNAPQKMSSK